MDEKGAAGQLTEQAFVEVAKTYVKATCPKCDFGALAAAGAQSTQFHSIPENVKNWYQKCHFGEARGLDFGIFCAASVILAVLWEACFQRARQTESRQGGGGTPWDL